MLRRFFQQWAAMSAVRRHRSIPRTTAGRLLAAWVTCALALAMSGGSAAANVVSVGTFGSFSGVEGIAADSTTGDVYVYDAGAQAIFKFDAEGHPADFSATGTDEISEVGPVEGYSAGELAVDNSSGPAKGDLYLARGGSAGVQIYSPAGELIGELSNEGLGNACGVAVDPSGAVYVSIESGRVNKYVPAAAPVANADLAASIVGVEAPCRLSVDSAGNVFVVTNGSGPVMRYEASQFGSLSPEGAVVDTFGTAPAVDPLDDDLYVDESTEVAIFGPHGEPFQQPLAVFNSSRTLEGSGSIAVNGFNGYAYVAQEYDKPRGIAIFVNAVKPVVTTLRASHVDGPRATLNGAVNPAGSAVTSCSFQYGTTTAYGQSAPCTEEPGTGTDRVAVHADVSGLSEGTTYHFRLLATNANGTSEGADQTFDTPAAPQVSNAGAARLTATEANVSADIDPQRLATSYKVEYGTSEAYGETSPSFELPAQDAVSHRVTVELAGLTPNTHYHARFVVSNPLGVANSSDVAFTTEPQVTLSCANEALRTGLSARLPDCRAYEQISPSEKQGANIGAGGEFTERRYRQQGGLAYRAASNGDSLYYFANNALAGSPAGGQTYYQSQRSGNEWLTTPLDPPNLLETTPRVGVGFAITAEYRYVSQDLSCQLIQTAEPLTVDTPAADIEVAIRNLYRRNVDGTYTLISNLVPENPKNETFPVQYVVIGATPDCKKIIFASTYHFQPESPSFGYGIYEWDEGALRAADVLPEGNRMPFGIEFPGENETNADQFSEDGSRIFFEAFNGSFERKLYMREDNGTPKARTVVIGRSETATPLGGAFYQGASKDGARVFFQANVGLTPGNPAASTVYCGYETGTGCDLYEYNTRSEKLADLSVDANVADSEGAAVAGVLGYSDDGSYVYFAAKGQLIASGGDPGENTEAQNQSQQEANVYLAHAGSLSFVGRISVDLSLTGESQTSPYSPSNDLVKWPYGWAARVTPDGKALLFMSLSRITSYDNTDALLGRPDPEAYLYSADTGKTVCVSCNPSGAQPVYLNNGSRITPTPIVPLTTLNTQLPATDDQPHALSDSGNRVFFESTDQLSPLVKGKEDNVYEWERAGTGTCTSSSSAYVEASGGCVYLLDSGLPVSQIALPAQFLDASASGDDVFLLTGSRLLTQDEDDLNDIYDLRVGGGIAGGHAAIQCEGEACQGLASATPTFGTPASSSFSGQEGEGATSPSSKSKQHPPTRAQKLARALKACAKKAKRRRQACRRRARKRYGTRAAGKSAARTGGKR